MVSDRQCSSAASAGASALALLVCLASVTGCGGAQGTTAEGGGHAEHPYAPAGPPPPPHPIVKHALRRIDGQVRVERVSPQPFADLDAALGPPGSNAIQSALAAAGVRGFDLAFGSEYARPAPDGWRVAVVALHGSVDREIVCLADASGLVRPCFDGSDPVWLGADLVYRRDKQLYRLGPEPTAEARALGKPIASLCVEPRCKRTSEIVAVDPTARFALVHEHGHGMVDTAELHRVDVETGATSSVFHSTPALVYLSSVLAGDGTACAYSMAELAPGADPLGPRPAELSCSRAPWLQPQSVLWSPNGAPSHLTAVTRQRLVLDLVLTLSVVDVDAKTEHRYEPAGLRFSQAWALGDGFTVALASDKEVGFANLDDETLAAAPIPEYATMVGLPTRLPRVLLLASEKRWVAEYLGPTQKLAAPASPPAASP